MFQIWKDNNATLKLVSFYENRLTISMRNPTIIFQKAVICSTSYTMTTPFVPKTVRLDPPLGVVWTRQLPDNRCQGGEIRVTHQVHGGYLDTIRQCEEGVGNDGRG